MHYTWLAYSFFACYVLFAICLHFVYMQHFLYNYFMSINDIFACFHTDIEYKIHKSYFFYM